MRVGEAHVITSDTDNGLAARARCVATDATLAQVNRLSSSYSALFFSSHTTSERSITMSGFLNSIGYVAPRIPRLA